MAMKESDEERAEDIRRLGTAFIQDEDNWFLAREKDGTPIGVLWVPVSPPKIHITMVKVANHPSCGFELLKVAEAETMMAMDLVPELTYRMSHRVTTKTMGSGDLNCENRIYCHPGEDFDPKSSDSRTVRTPSVIGGQVTVGK